MKWKFLFIPILALSLFSTSCDKGDATNDAEINWLVGTWVVDRDETTEVFVNRAVEKLNLEGDSIKDKLLVAATKKTTTVSIAKALKLLDNLEFTFTEKTYSKEAIGLGGEGKPYSIVARPASNQITISEGGENRTYTKQRKTISYDDKLLGINAKIFLELKKE